MDAIDASATQHQRARDRNPNVRSLNLLHGNTVEDLARAAPYNLIYAVSVFPFTDPAQTIPGVTQGLR
ncbi:hypothetical protein ABTX82_37770 [Streptomyces lavendulae]|uniref:hypothetical protein n=1 Tax=Streptomyces lavendulae TaxID=1914 RepID=UPI0033261C68